MLRHPAASNQKQPADQRVLGRVTAALVEELGTAIITGIYPPDSILPIEAELASQFKVSRSVLREAIKILNAKGLLTARPRRGTSVTPPACWNMFDPDVLRWTLRGEFSLPLLIEFTDMRLGVEPIAAATAAKLADAASLQRIRAGYERMEAAELGLDDPLDSDIAFHIAILDASGNRFFSQMKPLVRTALNFSIQFTDNIARDQAAKLAAHKRLCDAILARDSEAAARCARELLLDARLLMETGLQADQAPTT